MDVTLVSKIPANRNQRNAIEICWKDLLAFGAQVFVVPYGASQLVTHLNDILFQGRSPSRCVTLLLNVIVAWLGRWIAVGHGWLLVLWTAVGRSSLCWLGDVCVCVCV